MTPPLTGLVGGPVTPFKADDTIDLDTFARQIEFLVGTGVAAIAHPMHIGESNNLTLEERQALAGVLVQVVAGRVPTFVHVSSAGTRLSCQMAEGAARAGADGIVLLPPYHWKSPAPQIVEHFRAVAGAHGGKVIAYNSPKAVDVTLTVDLCRELVATVPGLIAIKDGTYHMEAFTDLCRFTAEEAPHVSVLAGVEQLLPSWAAGGRGSFAACGEVAPAMIRRLWAACESGNLAEARLAQYKVGRLLKLLLTNYPSTIKYALEVMGRPVGQPRAPLVRLSEAQKQSARAVLEELGVIRSEVHGWALREAA